MENQTLPKRNSLRLAAKDLAEVCASPKEHADSVRWLAGSFVCVVCLVAVRFVFG